MRLHNNSRVVAELDGSDTHLSDSVGEGLGRRVVCGDFAEAPDAPIA